MMSSVSHHGSGADGRGVFTPGPWHAEQYSAREDDPGCAVIAEHPVRGGLNPSGGMVVYVSLFGANDSPQICEANARLISAAPDLLKACQDAKQLLINDLEEPGRKVFWKLVDAIAKATGGQP